MTGWPTETLGVAALRGELTKPPAQQLRRFRTEVIAFALLAAGKRIAEQGLRLAAIEASETPNTS